MAIIYLAVYLIVGISYYKMFQKARIENAWLAFVPIANFWPFMKLIQKSAWNILWLLVPVANAVFSIIWGIRMLKAFGQNPWIVVLAIIPIVNIVYLILILRIAFSDQIQYQPNFSNNGQSLNVKVS